MRVIVVAVGAAVVLGLAACGGRPPAHHVAPAVAAPSPSPLSTAIAYPDSHPCWAFRQATTKGVPASAAGEDTMTWLQAQIGTPDTPLQTALQQFINGWQAYPPNLRKIGRATRAIRRLCRGVPL